MKKRSIGFKLIALMAFVVVVCIILLIPPVTAKVATMTGITSAKIKYVAQTIIGAGVGLMLISFGVAALTAPIVGIILIGIGITLLAYSLWPLFKGSSPMTVSTNNLNSMGTGA